MKSRISVTGNPAYDGRPFTAFATVTPETDVASLNLNWGERDLPERERTKHVHGLHPYLGKFIPQLVEVFLRKYRPKVVCDPFCGSGTTLVEANALGIDAVGCDISAFNCLLTKVKTYRYDLRLLERSVHDILVQLDLRLEPNLF
ncbi:MAG: site-specific DNA-methyltransferase [Firmicutes bacterium]|nr:site-specific DNA-methyltransferase [Bacillota bacterium]